MLEQPHEASQAGWLLVVLLLAPSVIFSPAIAGAALTAMLAAAQPLEQPVLDPCTACMRDAAGRCANACSLPPGIVRRAMSASLPVCNTKLPATSSDRSEETFL